MTIGLLLLRFFLLVAPLPEKSPDQVIACHLTDAPFTALCDLVYRETGVSVYYKESWVKNVKVTINSDSISIIDAVKMSLRGTNLKVSVWHSDLIISPNTVLLDNLPDYDHVNPQNGMNADRTGSNTEIEQRYITGRKSDVTQTLVVGKPGQVVNGNKATIRGRILDEDSGEPAIGATLFIEEKKWGAATDVNGFLTLVLPPGKYNAIFEYIGLETKKCLLEVLSDGEFTVRMKRAMIQMKEVVVFGDRQMSIKLKDPGLEKLSVKAIRSIPMMMGERDILKVSQMLPGIVSVGEGAAGINVRGGSTDQNAFYINKIPVFNTSHLFGFFPAFNSDIIQDFSIYKGHIPAEYGGRLSSVFNIITRQGNRKRFMARGGISPVAANLVIEGPLKKDTASFLLSARSTYSDWILGKIRDPEIWNSKAAFNDFSAAVNYDIGKSQLSLFGYHSSDRFELSDINSYQYANNGISLNFSHNYSNTLQAEYALIASEYSFITRDMQEISAAYEHIYQIGQYEARIDFNQVLNDKNNLQYGLDLIRYNLDRGTVNPYGNASLRNPVSLGKEQGYEGALYLSDIYKALPWLSLNLGIRYSEYIPTGPKTVYTYLSGKARDRRYISDSLIFGNGEPIKWYGTPQLRAAITIETGENSSVKISFNQMSQHLFMLSNTVSIAPNTQWKIADYYLRPSKSDQYSAGFFKKLPSSGWETSVELYLKNTNHFTEYKDGADFLNNPLTETVVLQGKQKSYGLEFMLKRNSRRVEGWMSYTYSRSIVTVTGEEDWEKINDGDPYPASYDIPHVLNAVINYHINRRITISSVVSYQSGKPVTYPVSVYYINDIAFQEYSKRNKYRIPDYFRTDFSVMLEGNLKKRKFIHSSLALNVYNLTGRDNPYSVYFKTENGRIIGYQYSVIGVPIFTATWLFKLGNYAAE